MGFPSIPTMSTPLTQTNSKSPACAITGTTYHQVRVKTWSEAITLYNELIIRAILSMCMLSTYLLQLYLRNIQKLEVCCLFTPNCGRIELNAMPNIVHTKFQSPRQGILWDILFIRPILTTEQVGCHCSWSRVYWVQMWHWKAGQLIGISCKKLSPADS